MRVNTIGKTYLPKVNNNKGSNKNVTFKADVRIDYNELRSLPKEQAEIITPYLEKAANSEAYKRLGSDNMLLTLRPWSTSDKNPNKKQYCIDLIGQFKDVNRARKEIIENLDRDFPDYNDSDIIGLKNKDADIMGRLKSTIESSTAILHLSYWPQVMENNLDKRIHSMVRSLSYGVPEEPKEYKHNNVASGPYLCGDSAI